MPDVSFYFQIHQPHRLRKYSLFDSVNGRNFENEEENRFILNRVVDKCYRPACELLLSLIKKYAGDFRFSLSISGSALDQMERYRPDTITMFQRLAATGAVEFLNETDAHSLAFLFSPREFQEQVLKHRERIKALFNQDGMTFRNTELIYSNALASMTEKMGYRTILTEGVNRILAGRSPNRLYSPRGTQKLRLLVRNHHLSDELAFRFICKNKNGNTLTAEKYAGWINKIGKEAVANIFIDFETIGEHQWAETGIFQFLTNLPENLLKYPDCRFTTTSEASESHEPTEIFDSPHFISWADKERDLSAWLGNAMQQDAAKAIYGLEKRLRVCDETNLIEKWRMLQNSDHFYYMSTKKFPDGDIHRYFSPYESPYAAYINYMNIVDDLYTATAKKDKENEYAIKKRTLTI